MGSEGLSWAGLGFRVLGGSASFMGTGISPFEAQEGGLFFFRVFGGFSAPGA